MRKEKREEGDVTLTYDYPCFENDLRKTNIVCRLFLFLKFLVHFFFSLFISLLINQHMNNLNIELYRFKRESLSFKSNTNLQ